MAATSMQVLPDILYINNAHFKHYGTECTMESQFLVQKNPIELMPVNYLAGFDWNMVYNTTKLWLPVLC